METSLHKENNETVSHLKTDYLVDKIELWAKEKGIYWCSNSRLCQVCAGLLYVVYFTVAVVGCIHIR